MKTKTVLAAALTATLGYCASAHAVLVDLFDDPAANGVNTVTDNNPTVGSVVFQQYPGPADPPSTSILGGYRDLVVDLVASNLLGTPAATLEVGGGGLSFSTSSGDTGIGKVQWDGNDNSGTLNTTGLRNNGVGVDLINQTGCPAEGCNAFVATVVIADQGFQYQIGLYTDALNYSILTSNTLFEVTAPTSADYFFEWFTRSSGAYFDAGLPFTITRFGSGPTLTNIGAIEFVVNSDGGTTAVDLALTAIEKGRIPEPNVLALMGIGLLGAGLTGRRKTRKVS
ncbi:MAG: PEP-CTERM sorting domain-containing protein [Candidatus Competibacter sp.]